MVKKRRCKTDRFIYEAKQIHGDKYDYSLVKFQTTLKVVSIICSKHGVFKQSPNSHLNGYGCKYCGYGRMTRADFLDFVNEIHDNKYDYSSCEYSQETKKLDIIKIICPIHGDFHQRLDLHLKGHGCPKCLKGRGVEYYTI